MDDANDIKEILEVVTFIKDKVVSVEERVVRVETGVAEVKRDVHEMRNRLDDELDKRKALEVRVANLEA